jgi:hypothetical protein
MASSQAPVAHFIPPPPPGRVEINPVFVEARPEPGGDWAVRASTYSAAARFSTRGGEGQLLVATPAIEPRERAVENITRIAVAWLAARRGGMLIHAACIERDGRAYVFFGQSGAGKSTLAALSRRGRVLTDDLTLLLPGPGRIEAVGSPFRGTYKGGGPVHGRFPVAAFLRLRRASPGDPPQIEELAEIDAMPAVVANLPFVVDQLHAAPELFTSIESILRSVPIRLLRFHKHDDSYWDAVDRHGL